MSLITIIFGKRRTGKTALNTKFALDEMANRNRFLSCINALENLRRLEVFLDNPPFEHVVYANYSFIDRFGRPRYKVNPFHMCLPNDDGIEYEEYLPNASFHIMEGQMVWKSKKTINNYACGFFENSGHNGFDIFIDVQRVINIHKDIREITDRFITILELNHDYNERGKIIKSTWKCLEFYDCSIVDEYIKTKNNSLGEQVEYTFNGCIFDYYNSFSNQMAYYRKGKKPQVDYGEDEIYFAPDKFYDK